MSSLQENSNEGKYLMMEELDIHTIDPVEMTQAKSVVDSVNKLVYNQLRTTTQQFKMRPKEPLVLQGSVADGTKVLKPDEFDYLIPMNLCCYCWRIETSDLTKLYFDIVQRHDHSDQLDKECIYSRKYNFRWEYIDQEFGKDTKDLLQICKHCKEVNNVVRIHGRTLSDIVFDECSSSIKALKNHTDLESSSNTFTITHVSNIDGGPAIKMTVRYKSTDILNQHILSIDYVPAVYISGRYFVCKQAASDDKKKPVDSVSTSQRLSSSKRLTGYWRESFSYDEQRLMDEIKTQSPTWFEMYRSFKALQADLNDGAKNDSNLTEEEYYNKFTSDLFLTEKKFFGKYTQSTLDYYSHKSELAILLGTCCHYNIILILNQGTQHLKTALFHLWKDEKLRKADGKILAEKFIKALNECVTRDHSINYFNGIQFRSSPRNSKYRVKY